MHSMANLISILGPGSFLEATKLIPLLAKNDDGPVFDVIAPSLPNFGFSQGVIQVDHHEPYRPTNSPEANQNAERIWLGPIRRGSSQGHDGPRL